MNDNIGASDFELLCIIVNNGLGSKVLHLAKQFGIKGGSILLGRGTVNNRILDFIGLTDIRKEIVLIAANSKIAEETLEKFNEKLKFEKSNHGIAFTIPILSLYGSRSCKCDKIRTERGGNNPMYNAIITIVELGKAEEVIDAATKAGSKGGTIINGRGSGVHDTSKLFLMDIEPEKEIVLILSEADQTDAIVSSIREGLKIDEAGKGIIFVQEVRNALGLV